MLLVIISIMMATIMTTAYLASRDNSAVIGRNVADSAAARWAALSGLDVGVAIMQTRTDWRNAHVNGKLLDDYAIGAASVDLDILDLESDLPPTSESEYLELTSTATAAGVVQVAKATAWITSRPVGTVDVDLSEFVIFAADSIALEDTATVTQWPNARVDRELAQPIAIGTTATAAGSVDLSGSAAAIDTTVFYGPGASVTLVSNSGLTPVEEMALLDTIPLPDAPPSKVSEPTAFQLSRIPFTASGIVYTVNADQRWSTIILDAAAEATWQGDIEVVRDIDSEIRAGSKVIVDGNVTFVTFGDITLLNSSIELMPNATLTVFVGGNLTVQDSYIGDDRGADVSRDHTGNEEWMDVTRIQIYTMHRGGTPVWTIDANSVIKGQLYGPDTAVTIDNQSAIYGRVTGETITIRAEGGLFYDASLNSGLGYTNPDSAIFNGGDRIKAQYLALLSLSDADLQSTADGSGDVIVTRDGNALIMPAGYVPPDDSVPVSEPTPRPIPIEYSIESFGIDVQVTESK